MPTIPVIERTQRQIGGGIAGPPIPPQAIRGFSQLGAVASGALIDAAKAIKTGRDKAKAGDSYNAYREASRQKLTGSVWVV